MNAQKARIKTNKGIKDNFNKKWKELLLRIEIAAIHGGSNYSIMELDFDFLDRLNKLGYKIETKEEFIPEIGRYSISVISW